MRVSVIGPVYPYRGGISHYTAMLACALAAAGHATQVISFSRQYPAFLYPGQTDKDPSRNPIQVNAEYLLDPLYPWTWLKAARRVLAFQSDVVVIQWWTTFWGPAFAALTALLRHKGVRVVYVIHNVLPHEQRRIDVLLAKPALSRGSAFIVMTQRERERLLKLLPKARLYDCPLPAYDLLQSTGLTRMEARRQLGLDPEAFLLLFFGFVRPYKGVHGLLDALGRLTLEGKCPRLAIVGEFWEDKADYQAQIERLGIEAQVRIEDRYVPDEEIEPWFRAADCLAAPYIAGTQSAAAGIALAHGLPMIASRQVAEGIAAEKRGALLAVVPPGDVDALAKAIAAAMQAPRSEQRAPVERPAPGSDWQRLVETIVAAAGEERAA